MAVRGVAPYKTIVTHGFVLDPHGKKMSKSLGNVIEPKTIIEGGKDKTKNPAYGADVARMWVAGSDFSSDVTIGPGPLIKAFETLRKIRNTSRFALGLIIVYLSIVFFLNTNNKIIIKIKAI